MKFAIHNRVGSFSDRWISYCKKNNIPYKVVDAFESNIIEQLHDCDVFMWHHHHAQYKDVMTAKRILFAIEHSGIKVFPDFNTGWHFDDKVSQKYLLEAIEAPLVPSYVFYNKKEALTWADNTAYPKVFKLKGGAGAVNVRLVKTKKIARKLIKQAFKKGFPQFNRIESFKEKFRKFKGGQENIFGLLKGVARLFISTDFDKRQPVEKGYIYFQDFIPNNNSDTRVIVIKGKAFAIKRLVRSNDFRASGSGTVIYDKNEIDIRCVKLAFDINLKLNAQSIAYDFVFDSKGAPVIVEISYGFSMEAYDSCPGYWDDDLNWHQCNFNPQEWMLVDIIESKSKK